MKTALTLTSLYAKSSSHSIAITNFIEYANDNEELMSVIREWVTDIVTEQVRLAYSKSDRTMFSCFAHSWLRHGSVSVSDVLDKHELFFDSIREDNPRDTLLAVLNLERGKYDAAAYYAASSEDMYGKGQNAARKEQYEGLMELLNEFDSPNSISSIVSRVRRWRR